jgi:hypothetical protein
MACLEMKDRCGPLQNSLRLSFRRTPDRVRVMRRNPASLTNPDFRAPRISPGLPGTIISSYFKSFADRNVFNFKKRLIE